jgi:hypothetical protein
VNIDPENPEAAIHKKVYTTKYALTQGIEEKQVKIVRGYAYSIDAYSTQYCPGEYFDTLQEAVNAAEQLRVKKIASLKNQIAKLGKMHFQIEAAT